MKENRICATCRFYGRVCSELVGICEDFDRWEPQCKAVDEPEYKPMYKDEVTTDGLKYDVGKVDFTFLKDWSLALGEICKLSEFGAEKYERGGWTKINDPERLYRAMLRHYFESDTGVPDEDSGFLHDVAVAWNALGALEIRLRNQAGTKTE